MTTMAGIVAVDREVFGEPAAGGPPHVRDLSRSAADTHLRQLCASCHVGRLKTELGPNGEGTRGGGCNACHLVYSAEASAALARYRADKARSAAEAPGVHPAVSLDIDNAQCFGCHSRSGRISTSYEGWHEVHEPPPGATDVNQPSPSRFRVVTDDRVFERIVPDVHQERGLDCIDCHTANEAMGDGVAHARMVRPSPSRPLAPPHRSPSRTPRRPDRTRCGTYSPRLRPRSGCAGSPRRVGRRTRSSTPSRPG